MPTAPKLLLFIGPFAILATAPSARADDVSIGQSPAATATAPAAATTPPTAPVTVAVPPLALTTFAPARPDVHYFLRVRAASGATTECYTPCSVALPAGPTHLSVIAPRGIERDLVLSGRPTLLRIGHLSPWRYWVGALLLAISLAEFTYGAVVFPWHGGGTPTEAAEAAAAWAFGALELTSAATLLAIAGKDRVDVIDDPTRLKSEAPAKSSVRLAGIGLAPTARGAFAEVRFRF